MFLSDTILSTQELQSSKRKRKKPQRFEVPAPLQKKKSNVQGIFSKTPVVYVFTESEGSKKNKKKDTTRKKENSASEEESSSSSSSSSEGESGSSSEECLVALLQQWWW